MIQAEKVRAYAPEPVTETYTYSQTILYALGVGAGADDLRYVYEKDLVAIPTMAAVLAREEPWLHKPEFGINVAKMLHGEQSLEIHRPLASSGRVTCRLSVDALHDKGEGRGALLVMKRSISDAQDGTSIATIRITSFLRADGGFGGRSDPVPTPRNVPNRPSDKVVCYKTTLEQALLYRLSGDWNPIHADPEVAVKAGFSKPILHGLCTYGVACRAILRAACKGVAANLKRFDARFSSPVYPGDTVVTEIWIESTQVFFRCWVPERDALVLTNGYAEIAG